MTEAASTRRVYQLFADLLEYPRPGLAETARAGEALVGPANPAAAALLREFRAFVEQTSTGRLEEIYTGTFDLDGVCYPYVGHHLFGETYKRSVFLLGLRERYQAHGFAATSELPDHLAVVLRFLATAPPGAAALSAELVQDALLPALVQMVGEGPEVAAPAEPHRSARVYQWVLRALRLVLQPAPPAVLTGAPASDASG